jgi:hypothetical protein
MRPSNIIFTCISEKDLATITIYCGGGIVDNAFGQQSKEE